MKREHNNKSTTNKFYNKLVFRLFMYFALIICMFAILLGVIYMKLYEKHTVTSFRNDLIDKAERISFNITELSANGDKSGFNAYLEAVKSIFNQSSTDVYIISNTESEYALSGDYTNYANFDSSDETLPDETRQVILKAFKGKESFNSGYDAWYYANVVRVAVPIKDSGGNVSGAVMIISEPQDEELLNNSQKMIAISAVVALLISFTVAFILAAQISGPMSKMGKTALSLAEGDYHAKTGLSLNGELGELAKSIDVLSDKLCANEDLRNNMEQMRRDFFANVSHELRTPITVIRGYAEILVDGVVDDEAKKQQYYARVLSECKTMERLVGDLLILSKMQNPDFQIEKEPVNLVQIFHDIIRGAKVLADKRNVKIQLKNREDCVMMMGDYDRLRQMFMVIVDNAIKFSNENEYININISCQTNIEVKIKDVGVVITKEELPFIFEKFYKSKLRQNAKGSGLGLVIAKQIALKHDGKISVSSDSENGTIFQFIFDKADSVMI